MKTFNEYWEHEACRECCDTHEERAYKAWQAGWNAAYDYCLKQIEDEYNRIHESKSSQSLSDMRQT